VKAASAKKKSRNSTGTSDIPTGINDPRVVEFTIEGEPCSKANSRRWIPSQKRFIKSKNALAYEQMVKIQTPRLEPLFVGELSIEIDIFYASHRKDLDESLILDGLQDKIYSNDRQVREKHVRHFIDRANPRADVKIYRRAGVD
jgi:Holliday junction resolvase RusA-like endonuclease